MATLGEIAAANATDQQTVDSRRRDERARERLKKERQRDRKRETARLLAIAEAERFEREAERREIINEGLAPAVLRNPVFGDPGVAQSLPDGRGGYLLIDGEPRMIVGARVQIVDGRPVRAFPLGSDDDVIAKLARDSKIITERHRRAARRLQQDWSDVGSGLNVGAVDYLRSGGGGDGSGGHDAMMAQVDARASLDGAMAHLGAFAPSVARVVLDCVPVSVWAAETEKSVTDAMAWLGLALDRLAAFYWPPKVGGSLGPVLLTFGPARETYDTALSDATSE